MNENTNLNILTNHQIIFYFVDESNSVVEDDYDNDAHLKAPESS